MSRNSDMSKLLSRKQINLFWNRVNKNGPIIVPELGVCHVWKGTNYSGYGHFSAVIYTEENIKITCTFLSHRLAYEIYHGFGSIPEGQHVGHLCSNRSCVRKEHITVCTVQENMQESGARRKNSNRKAINNIRVPLNKIVDSGLSWVNTLYSIGSP